MKAKFKVYSKEEPMEDDSWLDRASFWIKIGQVYISFDPYLNNNWKPWFHFMKGYNEARKMKYWLINFGWLVGMMIDICYYEGEEDG